MRTIGQESGLGVLTETLFILNAFEALPWERQRTGRLRCSLLSRCVYTRLCRLRNMHPPDRVNHGGRYAAELGNGQTWYYAQKRAKQHGPYLCADEMAAFSVRQGALNGRRTALLEPEPERPGGTAFGGAGGGDEPRAVPSLGTPQAGAAAVSSASSGLRCRSGRGRPSPAKGREQPPATGRRLNAPRWRPRPTGDDRRPVDVEVLPPGRHP